MLKNRYIRILITILIGILSIKFPLALIALIFPIYFFPNYIEALLVAIIVDSLYGINGSIIYTSSVFVVFIAIEIAKRRLRL